MTNEELRERITLMRDLGVGFVSDGNVVVDLRVPPHPVALPVGESAPASGADVEDDERGVPRVAARRIWPKGACS